MGLYLFLALVYFILGMWENGKKTQNNISVRYCLLMLFPMFLLTAFRDFSIGTDTIQYKRVYDLFANSFDFSQISHFEPGYLALNFVANKMGLSYEIFQLLTSIFIYGALYFVLKLYSTNIAQSCYMILIMRMMFSIMNISRSWISTAIGLFSIKLIEDRKPILYSSCIIFASIFFHTSAVIFLLLYPLATSKISRGKVALFVCFAFVIFIIGEPLFALLTGIIGRYENYLVNFDNTGSAVWMTFILRAILFSYSIYVGVLKDINSSSNLVKMKRERIMFAGSLILVCLDIVGLRINVINRVSIHYLPFIIFLTTYSIRKHSNKRDALFSQLGINILLMVIFVVTLTLRPEWNNVTPYSFWWN